MNVLCIAKREVRGFKFLLDIQMKCIVCLWNPCLLHLFHKILRMKRDKVKRILILFKFTPPVSPSKPLSKALIK
jgi:hypothetical protein